MCKYSEVDLIIHVYKLVKFILRWASERCRCIYFRICYVSNCWEIVLYYAERLVIKYYLIDSGSYRNILYINILYM